MNTARITERITKEEFRSMIRRHRGNIFISPHAIDHLSDGQRKVFKDRYLIHPLLKESPNFIGLQRNGRYIGYYRRKNEYLCIIIAEKKTRLEIVTYMMKDRIPSLTRK